MKLVLDVAEQLFHYEYLLVTNALEMEAVVALLKIYYSKKLKSKMMKKKEWMQS